MYILVLLVLLVGCSGIHVKPTLNFDSVVSVSNESGIIGSAVAVRHTIDSTYFLTCNHVATAGAQFIDYKSNKYKIKLTINHETLDVALVVIDKIDIVLAEVSTIVKPLDVAYAAGFPLGMTKTISIGLINDPIEIKTGWLCTAPAYKGNSGGGVFNSLGQLVGISAALGAEPGGPEPIVVPHLHVFVPVYIFIDWLEANCHAR